MPGYIQQLLQCFGVENAYPADSDTLCPGGQPKILHCTNGGVDGGFRHGLPAETMALFTHRVTDNAEILRSFQDAFELETAIELGSFAFIGCRGRFLGLCKEAV